MLPLNLTIGALQGRAFLMVILEMTVLANWERSSYIKFVYMIEALSDLYHRRPTGPYVFNDRPRIEETYINRDKEMIKEIRRKSIKDGMKQPFF